MHSTRRIMNRLSDEFLFLSGYLRSFRNQVAVEMLEPIDIVVTWVDGNDPAWLKEKNKYETCHNHFFAHGNGICRYRDWQIFRYWFRSIEQYAPWVNQVFFVTWGHVPKWLNVNAPKLKIIRHSDFIPAKYLPTFNSNPIESN